MKLQLNLTFRSFDMRLRLFFATILISSVTLVAHTVPAQTHPIRHSRYPNSASNDPQLQIPTDQAQSCYVPDGERSRDEQFQQFDSYPQPASKGYLCIAIPPGGIYVIDYVFAEADYDLAPAQNPEWYLDSVEGGYEAMIGMATTRAGSATANPHYILSQPMHVVVSGGTRVTLIPHNYFISTTSSIAETPGTASLLLIGHWQ